MKHFAPILSLLCLIFSNHSSFATPPQSPARIAADAARATLERNGAAKPPGFIIETGRPRRVEASLAYVASSPRMDPAEWIIFAPLPPELPSQRNVQVETTPKATPSRESVGLQRPLLMWRLAPQDASRRVIAVGVQYTMELSPRLMVPAPDQQPKTRPAADAVQAMTPQEIQAFTAPSAWVDFESAVFQTWLAEKSLRPADKETDLDFARRAFLFIKQNGTFEFKPAIERRSSVVCKTIKSDCGGLTALFVSVLRANGVPARQIIGRWASTAGKNEKLDGQEWQKEHIKTEFFAAGIGWIPVDISVAVAYDKRPDSLRQFGRDDGDFIALHIDPDLRLDTIHFGRQSVSLLQEPTFWVKGTGQMLGATSKSDWQVIYSRPPRPNRRP